MLHIIDNFPIQLSFLQQTSLSRRTFTHLNLCASKADLSLRNISCRDLIRGVAIVDNTDEYQEYDM
jgi:hypothetical protein